MIRITGMNSGLDTESIINELASARSMKVQKVEKEQTKLSWKIDAWKELNTKIYSLYTDVLSDMRFDYAYSKKTTKVSNPNVVSVVTGGDAVNGTQSLKVKKMATTAYLTGRELKVGNTDETKKRATGSTKLSELGISADAKFKLNVGDKTQEIRLSKEDTLTDVAQKFAEAGLNAKFDESSGRFFISAKTSGSAANFTMTSAALDIPDGLQTVSGLKEVPRAWSALTEAERTKTGKTEGDYNNARTAIINANRAIIKDKASTITSNYNAIAAFHNVSTDTEEQKAEKQKIGLKETDLTGVNLEDGTADLEKIAAISNSLLANNTIIEEETFAKQFSTAINGLGLNYTKYYNSPDYVKEADAATMVQGVDAEIELNGAEFTSSNNTFEINSLTITVTQETKDNETITLTTQQDTDGIYDRIKNFIKKYNELINEMDKLYNAKSASKYQPLTKEEKDAMSDTEVEEWEKKIKESLLRRDTTLFSVSDALKRAMTETSLPGTSDRNNGKDIFLSYFGIGTLDYFKSKDNEKNAYHIDGDSDDSNVKNNEDKLKKAIANDPDTVISFFKQLATNLYTKLDEKMARTDYSSSFTVYNDKQMEKDLKQYESKIAAEQKKLNAYVDRWYSKFSKMEVAMAKMQSKESSLSGLFSG